MLYLYQASSFLIDKSLYAWTPQARSPAALAFLVVFWIVYDVICRAWAAAKNDLIVSLGVTAFVVFAAWLACHLFAGAPRSCSSGR